MLQQPAKTLQNAPLQIVVDLFLEELLQSRNNENIFLRQQDAIASSANSTFNEGTLVEDCFCTNRGERCALETDLQEGYTLPQKTAFRKNKNDFDEIKESIADQNMGEGFALGKEKASTFNAGIPMAMTMLFCVKDAK